MTEDAQGNSGSDSLFRHAVVLSTALCLAATYAWLAGFVRQPDGDLVFHWRWLILPWALIGLGSTIYFWHVIWPPENYPGTFRKTSRKNIIFASLALVLPGLWWLVLPLRSQSGQHFWQVLEGLVAAALVLSFGALMIIRLGRAFENDDEADPEKSRADTGTKDERP
jgi:hypothetical protein